MDRIGLKVYSAKDLMPWCDGHVISTKIRPFIGESLMVNGQRVRIVDIAVNTGQYIADVLDVFVEEYRHVANR